MDQLDQLKAQLKDVENQLSTETAKGANKDAAAVAILEQRQADLLQQIMVQKQAVVASIATMSLADLQALNDKLLSEEPLDTELLQPVQTQIATLEQEQATQQEKEQRDQQQQQIIDNAVDLLPSIFGALFPAETFQQILGLNNYTDKQTQFYQIVKAYTAEQVQAASQAYEATIAQKDDKIKSLNTQSLNVQQQLDAANKSLQDEKNAHDKTTAELADTKSQLAAAQADSASKDESISELQNKLSAAQQTKAEPSANLQDMITQVKSKSDMSVTDLLSRWNARQTSDDVKVQVPEVPSTASATFPNTESTSDTVHNGNTEAPNASVQPPSLEVPTFQEVDTTTTGLANQEQGVQQAWADVSKEIERINARLDRLEKQANLPALEVA